MENFDHDVLIAGAGPVGLLLALDLTRRGLRVGLFEKNESPMPGSKGKGIQPRSQEHLEQLGLLDDFLAAGGRYPGFCIYKDDQIKEEPYAAWIEPTPDRPYPNILLVPQVRTEEILRHHLQKAGVVVHFGHELIGLEQDADGVTASIAGKTGAQKLRARFLVGSDGGHSFVRHALAIEFTGETLERRGIFADTRIDGLSTDVWHRWPEAPGGQLSLCPLLGTNLFQTAIEVPAYGDIDLSEQAVAKLIHGKLRGLDIAVREVSWRSLLRVNLRLAERYRVGRVFLAGDAAHIHPPTGAQGLNTGVQDAYNLGWKLAAVIRGADPELLDSYESERRPIAQDMLALSGSLLHAWRDQQKTQRGTLTHQLELNYRQSPCAVDLRSGEHALQAGDRAPDARGKQAGEPVRIFELLRHPHFTLLGFDADAQSLAAVAEGTQAKVHAIFSSRHNPSGSAIEDTDGLIRKIYGLKKGDVILVRPDGYIGAWAPASRVQELRPLLAAWTGAASQPTRRAASVELPVAAQAS